MAFPKSRILSTQQLVRQIIESNRNGERFCFILGSGASVESGIPSGNTLEKRWMDCIMGEADDLGTAAMDPSVMRQCGNNLYEEELIEHSFEELETAWKQAKKDGKSISSSYYFDIYKLRFYPNQRNGYRYLERIMESCEPSLGYHTLALLLASSTRNNLVITTNFDSLVEDALFLYTDKKPLVVSHESLAGYIESDIQRPIVAKVHRGLMYAPFNSPDTTNRLKDEWREALNYALSTYTPIVIGYGGGDHSLMAFLEEENTVMRHSIYWCYRESSGLPDEGIQSFLEKKDGYLVSIGGFDAFMLEIGNALYKDEITPTGTDNYLKRQYVERVRQYNKQWDELNKKPEMQGVLQPMNEAEQVEEKKREENEALTSWDYIRRGNRFYDERNYQEAISEYQNAITLDPNNALAYSNQGSAYTKLRLYEKAIEACTLAIEIDPSYTAAYNNRGSAYGNLNQYEKAIRDYTKAIELDINHTVAYSNRGSAYDYLGQYDKAIEDCTKAIELDPNYATAYNNRGSAYDNLKQYDKAIEDYTKAIEIDFNYATAYNNRGSAHDGAGQTEAAIRDYTKAIQIDPNDATVYSNRGSAYNTIGKYEAAIADCSKAIELDPNYALAYSHRGYSYDDLGQYDKAVEDYTKALELEPNNASVYHNRGVAYKNWGNNEKAIEDYSRAIQLDPNDRNTYLARAKVYRTVGEDELAEKDEKIASEM